MKFFGIISIILAVVLILISFLLALPMLYNKLYNNSVKKEIWLEIHDVSPLYGIDKVEELVKIAEKYNVSKIYIFLIPKHGNFSLNKEFAEKLKKICRKPKCEIGVHGYMHAEDEFNVGKREAENLIKLIKKELSEYNITARIFLPPRWQISEEALEIVKRDFDAVFLKDKIIFKNYSLNYWDHEYCWYKTNIILKKKAEIDYIISGDVFRLSVHVNASNTKECIEFLEEFLAKFC